MSLNQRIWLLSSMFSGLRYGLRPLRAIPSCRALVGSNDSAYGSTFFSYYFHCFLETYILHIHVKPYYLYKIPYYFSYFLPKVTLCWWFWQCKTIKWNYRQHTVAQFSFCGLWLMMSIGCCYVYYIVQLIHALLGLDTWLSSTLILLGVEYYF